MTLRDLLVVLDGSPRSDAVLDLALGIARRHDAHLTGLCPLELLYPPEITYTLTGHPELLVMRELAAQWEREATARAGTIETRFREALRHHDVRGDWQAAAGPASDVLVRHAHATDLVVLGQVPPDAPLPEQARYLLEDALMRTGRPLLLVPFAGRFQTVGANVVIGWNGTREAARAAHDALMLTTLDATVTVLTVERSSDADEEDAAQELPGTDMAEHLARHDLNVTAARSITDGSITDGDVLLNYAADAGADLLVIGGYGHSRTREMILGGVSRELLGHMTLPVLMSH